MVDVLVVALVVVLARAILPALANAPAGVLHVASGATTRQGRGAGAVFPMAYSTPAWSLTFSNFVATSQGHLVFSLS